jgi:anti-sigma factor RsiW
MTCGELSDSLCDFVGGELPPERHLCCQQHLDGCPPCVALLEGYRLTVRLGHELPVLPVPAHLVARLRVLLTAQSPPAPEPGAQPTA